MQKIGDRAAVLGASMAGLLAARVLADSYRRVANVRPDPLPAAGSPPDGVPPGPARPPARLPRGAQIPGELSPGLLAGLAAGGVPVLRSPREFRFFLGGHLLSQGGEPGEPVYAQSRPYLEHQVRDRVRALPGVTVWDRCAVAGLVTTPARDRVVGARVLPEGGGDQILAADLVVDATGRGRRTPPRPPPLPPHPPPPA